VGGGEKTIGVGAPAGLRGGLIVGQREREREREREFIRLQSTGSSRGFGGGGVMGGWRLQPLPPTLEGGVSPPLYTVSDTHTHAMWGMDSGQGGGGWGEKSGEWSNEPSTRGSSRAASRGYIGLGWGEGLGCGADEVSESQVCLSVSVSVCVDLCLSTACTGTWGFHEELGGGFVL
jgi:hypothetical protein